MSRGRIAGTLGALVLLGATAGSSGALAGDSPTTTVGVQNGASEFSFTLSRAIVDPGPSIIQYQNTGEDPHDLKVKRRGDERIFAVGELEPGGVGSVMPRLKRGSRYDLWCSLDGHRDAGMEATLRVRKKGSGD